MTRLAALVALAAAGCTFTPAPDGPAAATTYAWPDEATVEDTSRAVFERVRARWAALRPDAYTFTYEAQCFCAERGPFEVRVAEGRVESTTPDAPDYRRVTLDSLYATVAGAYARGAASVRFQYGRDDSLLAGFWIDYDEAMADEEMGARVTRLVIPAP